MSSPTIGDVPGVRVGHWTDAESRTGCTVMIPPIPNVAAVEIRGAAPGTRETALLGPGMTVQQVDALVFTGGSAFGLGVAQGVMERLAEEGRGHPTPAGPVPIVPAAVIFDLAVGRPKAPGAAEGAAAFDAARQGPTETGEVGAGCGATVGKWRGQMIQSGLGSYAVEVGECTVGALAVVNAIGDLFSLEGDSLTGGDAIPGVPSGRASEGTNTTLVSVFTDARLDRNELGRLNIRAHDAMAACIRPVHTRYDGDISFAVSCGERTSDTWVDQLIEAAFHAVGRAIEQAAG